MSSGKVNYTGYEYYLLVQDFESKYNAQDVKLWFDNNWHYSLYIAAFYLIAIFSLREYMKDRKPLKIRKAVLLWDTILAVFSTCGMLRIVPETSYILTNFGMEFSVCDNTANSVSMFWAMAFVLSKAPELLDTIFVVLKKQQLTFLHVAHHVLTLVFTWILATDLPAAGRWIIAINYSVHSFMYTYFAFKAAKVQIPLKVSMIVTSAQILQLVVLLVSGFYALRANLHGRQCTTSITAAIAGITFGSFLLYLFVSFFVNRYNQVLVKPPKKIQ